MKLKPKIDYEIDSVTLWNNSNIIKMPLITGRLLSFYFKDLIKRDRHYYFERVRYNKFVGKTIASFYLKQIYEQKSY